MILNREQILQAQDLKQEVVSVPEWGGDVIVRTLTGAERDQFEADMIQSNGKVAGENLYNLRARLSSLCLVDESGRRLFSDDDVKLLGAKSAHALQRVFEQAMKLNALSEGDVEELAGNSVSAEADDSGSS